MDALNLRNLLYLIAAPLILVVAFVNASSRHVTLYSQAYHEGDLVQLSFENQPSSCISLQNEHICNENNFCRSADEATKSFQTWNTCVRLFSSHMCQGSPLLTIGPGTGDRCSSNLNECGLKNMVNSMSRCLPAHNEISGTFYISETNRIDKGKIETPNFPGNYPHNTNMNWIINTSPWQRIEIVFTDFEIEIHTTCEYDNVTITEFDTMQVIYEGCGYTIPPPIISKSNQVMIKFMSDGSASKKGFSFNWMSCTDNCLLSHMITSTSTSTARTTTPHPTTTTPHSTTETPRLSITSTSTDALREALTRIGLVSFHTMKNFMGNSYSDNRSPSCHEMPPYFRRYVESVNDAWKTICLYSEKNCGGESISTEHLDRNTQLSNLTSIGWSNKISSWKPSSKGSTC